MDTSAILTFPVLLTTCLFFGSPVSASKDPYIFLLDVGNAALQKTTFQQTLLSVTGGSLLYRYPASGDNGGVITHANVVGKDYGSDLTAVITSGGPGYPFIEVTVIGQEDIPYQLLVTVEGQKINAEISVPDSSSIIPDDLESYGSVPAGSAEYQRNRYTDEVIPASENEKTKETLETDNLEDSSNMNEQHVYYSIEEQTDEEFDNKNQGADDGDNDDGVLPSKEIGDEMYPDEPRFRNSEQYIDSYDSTGADSFDSNTRQEDTLRSNNNGNSFISNEFGVVEENETVELGNKFDSSAEEYPDNVVEQISGGNVGGDNNGDGSIEENNYTDEQNDDASQNGDSSNLTNDMNVISEISPSDKVLGDVFDSENMRTNSYLVSNNPYKFWDMNNVDAKINEIDKNPDEERSRISDFPLREKKAPEEYPWDEDELPDPALYQRYKVLKPHLYEDVQMGPHGERQDLNVSPHWTNDMKSDSSADEQNIRSHNGADTSREDDDGSYDNDDVSAVLY